MRLTVDFADVTAPCKESAPCILESVKLINLYAVTSTAAAKKAKHFHSPLLPRKHRQGRHHRHSARALKAEPNTCTARITLTNLYATAIQILDQLANHRKTNSLSCLFRR